MLETYAAQQGLPLTTGSGDLRLEMLVDGTYSLRLHPLRDGAVLLDARLCLMPEGQAQRTELILKAAHLSTGLMRAHASTCVLSEDGLDLRLQQAAQASTPEAIDQAVGDFVNALAFWSPFIHSIRT